MMAGGQWKVVGAKSKKSDTKNAASKIPKETKKPTENSKTEVHGPTVETHTMFDAFLDREKKEPLKRKNSDSSDVATKVKAPNPNHVTRGKESQQKKKKGDKKLPVKLPSLESVIATVTDEDIKNLFATIEARFPNAQNVWLKDLVSFLNVKFDVPVEDPVFSSNTIGYPCSVLKKGVYKQMVKMFDCCTPQTLQLFFAFCIQTLVQDTIKGINTLGYRIVIQCLAQEVPSVVTANLAKCTELVNLYQNRQNIALSILWAAGQAGNKNLDYGLRVWIGLMFPLLKTKVCGGYVIDFLERLISFEELPTHTKSLIAVKDFFSILDCVYSRDIPGNARKKLLSVYPKLKDLSYGSHPELVLRHYFQSYLVRLQPQITEAFKNELLYSLTECLALDKYCYSVWRQLYTKYFVQSRLLIGYLSEKGDTLPQQFPVKCLKDTVSTFQVTNDELLAQGKSKPDVQECIKVTSELLAKMNSHSFSWVRMVLIAVSLFLVFFTYDVFSNGSFSGSVTGKFMKNSGLLAVCVQAGEKITFYSTKAYSFLKTNGPIYIAWSKKTFGPYFESFWEELLNVSMFIWRSTLGIRTWCNRNIPPVLETLDLNLPVIAEKFSKLLVVVASFVSTYVKIFIDSILSYIAFSTKWLLTNVFVDSWSIENIQKFVSSSVDSLQQYMTSIFKYISAAYFGNKQN